MSEELDSTVAPASKETAAAPAVCRLLRTKTAFGTYVGNLYSWQSGSSTTAVYWCLGTMETAGPDDGYAHPHTCCAGRDCYEEQE
ncbi:MAG TPA: hypothetical protein VEQ40_03975 [Pyrinomonadaceae bacterium]|nr:hypothetical protein [Pyrinomonadaceae bacterium]